MQYYIKLYSAYLLLFVFHKTRKIEKFVEMFYKFIKILDLVKNIPSRGGSRIFFRRGALVSCATSTPINHIVFFAEYQLY